MTHADTRVSGMNLSTLLVAPWRVTARSQGWLMLALFALCTAAAIAIGIFSDPHPWWPLATGLYCAGIAFFWMFQIPFLLLVSMDAHRLRVPGVTRSAAGSAALYAVLCIALPVISLAPFSANPAMVALAAASTIAGGLLFAMAARYAFLLGYILFFALQAGAHFLHLTLPAKPGEAMLLALGTAALLVVLALDVWRWRTLARGDADELTGMRGPMMMQFGRNTAFSLADNSDRWQRSLPEWMRPCVDLQDVAPENPARAIRVALGRGIMPVTWQSHLRGWAWACIWIVVGVLVMATNDAHSLLGSSWLWLLWGGAIVIAIPSGRLTLVRRRWQGRGNDLALLRLLPGLGTPTEQKRHALRAILLLPLIMLLGALLICWIIVRATHAASVIDTVLLLAALGSAALLCASVLATLGGKPIGGFVLGMLFVALLLLLALTYFAIAMPGWLLIGADNLVPITAGWFAWLLAVAMPGLRGWRGLLRRPHPFLANES